MSLSLWKIQRELIRPFKQLSRLPPRLGSLFFAQPYYDHILARRKRTHIGAAPQTNKVAIYLIFPQTGVLASHKVALRYLIDNGYSPVVVSNLPLSDTDREELTALSSRIIERPNFGYDFGGYRDGVLEVINEFKSVERLVLLNDSAWFPLPNSGDWLHEAEALKLDFVGAASNYGHERVDLEDYKQIRWSYSCDHRNFHYCSFALMISENVLKSPAFRRFWRKFPLTNNKTVTVRRGEIGLSSWIISHGFSHGSTLDISGLDTELAGLSDTELTAVARGTIIPEMPRAKALREDLMSRTATREELIGFILTAVARQGISYTQPRLMHQSRGFAFLKKSPIWLDEDASDLTLRFVRDLDGPFGDTIRDEALNLRQTRGKAFAASADAA